MSSVFRRPGSPFWFAAYRAADGRRQKKSTKQVGKARAEAVLAQLVEAERLAGQKIMTEAQGRRLIAEIVERTTGTSIQFHTCREWLEEWCASKTGATSERTLMKYKQITRDFLNHLGDRAQLALAAVTPRDVRSFRDAMVGHGHAPSTINQTVRKILSAPFLSAQRLGYLQTNPCVAVEVLKDEYEGTRDVFTEEQVSALYAAAEGDWKGVILAGYFTGLRMRDITELRWESLDLQKGLLRVKMRKTGGVVVVPLHDQFSDWLKQQTRGIGRAAVFPSLAGVPGSGRNGLSMMFARILKKADVKNRILRPRSKKGGAGREQRALSFHSLRHSFVSALANAGVAQELRQKLAGHSDERSHARSTHHELMPLQAAVAKLPALILS